MNLLHICNDLTGSKVHENLYKKLEELGTEQKIYFPIKHKSIPKFDKVKENFNSEVIKSKTLIFKHRLLLNNKTEFLYEDLKSKIDLETIDLVHATTLFSDGALAYRIFKEYKIPYIVAVRGTDVNLFMKLRYDLHPLGRKIVSNAKNVIFISKSLEINFYNSFFARNLSFAKSKSIIMPNAVDSFWLNNKTRHATNCIPKKILYIGKFNSNKNVLKLVNSFLELSKKHKNLTLSLVGKDGNEEPKIIALAKKHPDKIIFLGPIYKKEDLLKIYQSNDIFAMVSNSETFGLVYIEALSQGLPILYTNGQGIDGTFKENIGVSANPKSMKSIMKGMETLINNYSTYQVNEIDFSKYSWKEIALNYINIYNTKI